jgi:hypothetical protein
MLHTSTPHAYEDENEARAGTNSQQSSDASQVNPATHKPGQLCLYKEAQTPIETKQTAPCTTNHGALQLNQRA